jgi:hypothetical protein
MNKVPCYVALVCYVLILAVLSYFTSPWVICIILLTGFSCRDDEKTTENL